ncbi:MAG: 5-oxoprolinase subunit PxpB, partial [Candidatus Rokuibacteriota bacterium]
VGETVPTYRALLVYYDPLVVGYEELVSRLRLLLGEARPEILPPVRTVELPCCYGGELGFELETAARKLALAPDELARLHAEADYYVYFVGFTPGLPYMTGMSERLTIPRLTNPRLKTPPGSVSIGGVQCCIYSVESPGGFWVLGRTPVRLYDPTAPDPILLRAGDHVRFRAIDRAEYDAIAAEVDAGRYRLRIDGPVTESGH